MTIRLFDTTLRDGSQAEGISFSPHDKLRIAQELDRLGIHYIEGGWPGSNPKDNQFFQEAQKLRLGNARLVAFGSTRRKDMAAADDPSLQAIASSGAPAACIFGKSWDLHVEHALRATLDENLQMVRESVAFLKSRKLEVIYDAEHFFDGYRENPSYALKTLQAALDGGADNLTLCDTNGGGLPPTITQVVAEVRRAFPQAALGIHVHNDSGCGVANTLAAVEAGATLVQGVLNGFGERCGNVELATVIADLQLKMNRPVLSDAQLRRLSETVRVIAEIANIVPNDRQPYVGRSAFAHKGGVHVSAVARLARTYEHIDPALVGNERRILVSELSGKANVLYKSAHLLEGVDPDTDAGRVVLNALKRKELEGYHFEGAEASFELLVQKELKQYKPAFQLESYRVLVEGQGEGLVTEATVKLSVNGRASHTVGEGDGPVNALDHALRAALEPFYPALKEMTLTDYKVRVLDASAGTAAKVRVLIESRDHKQEWSTMGVSTNLIEASWLALVDAVEYKLLKDAR